MPRSRPRTRGTRTLRTPAVALGFCDSLRHHLQLKSVHGTSSTSLLWIRMKSVSPLYSSRSLPKHRILGFDEAVAEALGERTGRRFLGEYGSAGGELPGKRFSDWQRCSMQIRFCAAFPVYEILTVACLSRRLLPFLMR